MGRSKARAASRAIAQMNFDILVDARQQCIGAVEDVAAFLPGKDLVVSAIDETPFVAPRLVNKAIVETATPCVFAASQVSRGRVFMVVPGQTGSFYRPNAHYSQRYPQFVSQFAASSDLAFGPPSIAYGPSVFILTATIVAEATRILTGCAPPRSLGAQFEDGSAFAHPS